jgi:redox-sensitive bicupin YhaK (pirin superfamily)
MFKYLPKEKMGTSNLGWLESRFHFSFAQYRNQDNINFGVLRVLNDDIIHPQSGFDTHPHQNMEIISYIVDGEISHKDSMGNMETLKRGEVQYLSAGDGIFHSEHNLDWDKDLRLLQMWIIPPEKSLARLYSSHRFKKEERQNKLLNIVSSQKGDAKVQIHQNVEFYVSEIEEGKSIQYEIGNNRQVYFVQIEGNANINGIELANGDAMEIVDEKSINIDSKSNSHILFINMPKSSSDF